GMPGAIRFALGVGIVALTLGAPIVFFRAEYAHHKRLRVVTPGVLYRSGQLTVEGFRDAVARFGIRTIINCQNEYSDPDLPLSFWTRHTMRESDLCRDLGDSAATSANDDIQQYVMNYRRRARPQHAVTPSAARNLLDLGWGQ